jgi:hypothetical protein
MRPALGGNLHPAERLMRAARHGAAILECGESTIVLSVNHEGPFPPSKRLKVEKVELHLEQRPELHC